MKGPTFEFDGLRLEALSVGGLETCLSFPDWRVAFDIGRSPEWVVKRDRVFFTHAHVDHLAGVAYHCATRSMRGMPTPHYWMPKANLAAFGAMMKTWEPLDGSEMPHVAHGLEPGDEVPTAKGQSVRALKAFHTVPTLGYCLVERRQKLKPELFGTPGRELARMRDEGHTITNSEEHLIASYAGDTLIEAVERVPEHRAAKLLILECTFVDDRISVEECRSRGHVHIDEIVERAHLFENEHIALMHFSARYTPDEIRGCLAERLPADLAPRVTPLI